MELTYQIYHNLSSRFGRVFAPGDHVVAGYSGAIQITNTGPRRDDVTELLRDACEEVFIKHNQNERPDGQDAPSLSVGDVVVFGETALSVASVGFAVVNLSDGIIEPGPWSAAFAAFAG